jgi:hypothetical protein
MSLLQYVYGRKVYQAIFDRITALAQLQTVIQS